MVGRVSPVEQWPTGTDQRWRDRAACLQVDPELFFPAAESGPVRDAQEAQAKAVCGDCPVRAVCLVWALDELAYGIAGGLTEDERRRYRENRRRSARPAPAVLSCAPTAPATSAVDPQCRRSRHVYDKVTDPAAGWRVCACEGSVREHSTCEPWQDPTSWDGCGWLWRACGRCGHVDERHVTQLDTASRRAEESAADAYVAAIERGEQSPQPLRRNGRRSTHVVTAAGGER